MKRLAFLLLLVPAVGLRPASVMDTEELERLRMHQWAPKGDFAQALDAAVKARDAAIESLGPVHPDLVAYHRDLATIHRYRAEFLPAENELRWALALAGRQATPDPVAQARLHHDLGCLAADRGMPDEAEMELAKAWDLDPKPQVAQSRGDLERSRVRWKQAAHWYRQSKAPLKLGLALARAGEAGEAGEVLKKELDRRREESGTKHHAYADALDALAVAAHLDGRSAQARDFLVESEAIRRGTLGPLRWEGLDLRERAAWVYAGLGEQGRAVEVYRGALETCEKFLGKGHPRTGMAGMRLGRLLKAAGKAREAAKTFDQGQRTAAAALGEGHPALAGQSLDSRPAWP